MKYIALGGGSEVGASCNLLHIDGKKILLDAGIRMSNELDSLPDLALLQDSGGVDAIVVSHAHMDHIGALPLVHRAYPNVPIYATQPTTQLMRVLLADAIKIMSIKADQELECPLYDEELVNKMFTRVMPVSMGGSIQLPDGIRAFFFPAGHILGASMIGIEGTEGRVLYTGDISVGNQRTINGMILPDFAPHLLITESTYGNRLHANRQREEKGLAQTVAEVIESGGHALIPAFALGRAQEIILLIQDYQQKGLIPKFPIWVDGMVRSICQTYHNNPEHLRGPLKRFVNNGGNPFFREKNTARPVTATPQREKILAGAPACIISSSGMLTGGPSQFYASRLVDNPKNAIIFCGYQDEESPGRRLLTVANNPEATINLGGNEVRVHCRLAQYGLSAHADAGEIVALATHLKPRQVILVHGDHEARENLAKDMHQNKRAVLAPDNGEWLEFTFKSNGRKKYASADVAKASKARSGPVDLGELWNELVKVKSTSNKLYSIEELSSFWYGDNLTPESQEEFAAVFKEDNQYFASDWKHSYFYRPRRPDQVATDRHRESIMGKLQHLPGKLILIRDSNGAVRAGICYAIDKHGFHAWKVGRDGTYHPAESLLEIIAPWYESEQEPLDEGKVRSEQKQRLHHFLLKVKPIYRKLKPRELWEKMNYIHKEPVGAAKWVSLLDMSDDNESLLALAWRLNTHLDYFKRINGEKPVYACREEMPLEESGTEEEDMQDRMEQNAAMALIDDKFPGDSGLYKKGYNLNTSTITLNFNFPQIAEKQYSQLIDELSATTGWLIEVYPEANHNALTDAVRRLIPANWNLLKNPAIHRDDGEVRLKCDMPAGEESKVKEVLEKFKELTWYRLIINTPENNSATQMQSQKSVSSAHDCIEINMAYTTIKTTLQKAGATVYKTSKKQNGLSEFIEISFINPIVGKLYRGVLDQLEEETGWPIQINPKSNQHEIKAIVRSVIDPAWGMAKEPSFFEGDGKVLVKLKNPPSLDSQQWIEVVQKVYQETGCHLEFK